MKRTAVIDEELAGLGYVPLCQKYCLLNLPGSLEA